VTLLSVPEGSESDDYTKIAHQYVHHIADFLTQKNVEVNLMVTGSVPTQTILRVSREQRSDLIMMVSHGRCGIKRQTHVKLGSVADALLQETPCPVFLVSAV
jgi:nucleotide-binding universal stress UspA family protein